MSLNAHITHTEYLFWQFRTMLIPLKDVVKCYFPHMDSNKALEKVRKGVFPIPCRRLDDSQKAPYFVHIKDLADFLDRIFQQEKGFIQTDIQHATRTLTGEKK